MIHYILSGSDIIIWKLSWGRKFTDNSTTAIQYAVGHFGEESLQTLVLTVKCVAAARKTTTHA